ncbi:mitofilin family membrane protein [Magnetospirillum sp. UT-4]|uniref:mitofilin family membrane protein n=1 Tax=Magnetospirillum sp. UT-4 TaxID=2681467 RepID=UPI00138262A1|nr:mitofilin family membrane protein [Magnetospirillum sp. UT-4]CAA7616389.1 Putative membrane protein involved in heme biosynthesis. Conserved among Magnestospirilla in the MAI [Magnetospirillum sp. UT-4]
MSDTDKPEAAPPETKPEDAAVTPVPRTRKTPWGAVGLAVLVAAGLGLGAVTWPQWKHLVPADGSARPGAAPVAAPVAALDQVKAELAATRDDLRRLEARLAGASPAESGSLETRLAATEQAVQALAAQPPVPVRLAGEVEALATQLAELKRVTADAAMVLRLTDRVEKVEAEMRDLQARRSSAAALLLAVGQLREALAKALPYDAELRALKALAGQDAEIAAAAEILKERAAAGIPTAATLQTRFHAMAAALVRAEVLPADAGWVRQTLDRLASLVTIRREDGAAAGASPAAVVARAEARLAEGDLAGAAAEVEGLDGAAAEMAAPWAADARARIAADRAVSELAAHVVAQVGARQ